MDRTCEFVSICILFDTGSKPQQIHKPLSNASRWSEQIADQMRQNEQLLVEFEELVNTKNFSGGTITTQIATLIDILKKDLKSIDENILQFQQNMKQQSGKHPQHYQAHFSVVASLLKTRCAKSAKRFHAALQRHTEMIKAQSTRRSRFSHSGTSPVVRINTPLFSRPNTSSMGDTPNKHMGQIIPTTANSSSANTIDVSSTEDLKSGLRRRGQVEHSEKSLFSVDPSSGSSAKQSMQIYTRRNDSQTRYQNASQVESTIVEISGMYSRMANLVAEQGELLTRIDDNMETAQQNVESAQGELLKLYHMVSGNRSLIIKIFIVLILVIILTISSTKPGVHERGLEKQMLSQTWSHGSMDQKFVDTKLHDSRQSECKFFAGIVAAFLEVQQIVCKQGKEDITLMNKQLENAREAMQTTMLHDAIRFIISRDEQQALHETVQMQNEEKLQRVRELFAEKAISRRFEAKLKEIELATTHRMDEILKKSSQRKLENEHLKSRIIALEKEIRIKEDELAESHFKLDLEEKNASEKSIMQRADWDAEKTSLEAINKELTQVQSDSLAQGKCMQMSTDRSDSDAQDLLYKKSVELIDQGEKNIAMSAKLRAIKQLHQTLRRDVEQARLVLLQSINSSTDFDTSVYQHVKLEELLRIRLQNVDLERPSPTLSFAKEKLKTPEMVGMEKKEIMDTSCTHLPHVHPFSVIDTSGKGSRLEREVQILRSRCKRSLEGKEKAELELERAVMKLDALQGIKEKFLMISTRDQNRKEVRINMESQLKESNDKLVALSQHTEKLMLHVKVEAIAKAKVLESLKSLKKEHQELVQAHTRLQQDYHTQSKTLNVTMEESQLLRDQLYLMDQKVAEMGHKMDCVRSSTQKELKRAYQEADALRTKLVPGSESPEMQPITGITSRTDASIGSPTQLGTADSIKTHGRRGYTQKLIDKDTNVTSRRFGRSEKRYALGKSHNGVAKLSKI